VWEEFVERIPVFAYPSAKDAFSLTIALSRWER